MAAPIFAQFLRKNGQSLIEKAVDSVVMGKDSPNAKSASLPRRIAGAALMRVATKSVPGAILVGGALLAKHLHERKRAKSQEPSS
jgi:hypothetical protein